MVGRSFGTSRQGHGEMVPHQGKPFAFREYRGARIAHRRLTSDNRSAHPKDPQPTWWGDSIGHWEGDQLVVDTVGFNGKTWLDLAGHPASDQLHVIERYSRPDFGHLKWEITIEDPIMYTRPWKVTEITPLMTTGDLIEYVCTENERDVRHLVPGRK